MIFNNNSPLALQRELNGLSIGLGRSDITTTFQGDGAYATTNRINVPKMPLDARLTNDQMRVMRGYHIHEVGHILHTNDNSWKRACNRYQREGHMWKKDVLNALEDVMIERKINEQFAGAKYNLEHTVDAVLERNLEQIAGSEAGVNPADEVPYAILQKCRKAMGYDTPNLDAYINQLSDEVVAEADKWVSKVLTAENTTDCVKLANRLSKWMEDQGVGGSNDDEGQGQQGDEQGQEGEGQQAQDGNSDDEGIEGDRDQPNAGKGTQKATLSIQDLSKEGMEAVVQSATENVALPDEDQRTGLDTSTEMPDDMDVYSKANMRHLTEEERQKVLGERVQQYDSVLQQQSASLRRRSASLARVLQSQENEFWMGGKTEGRLDRNRMVGVLTGEENIFAERVLQQTRSTSIMVMMDQSGSMHFEFARAALVVLNETLGRAHVPYSMIGWSSGDVQILKTFKQRGRDVKVKQLVGGFGDYAGGTCPVPALLRGYHDFHQQSQEARRIMLFCSDAAFDRWEAEEMLRLNKAMEREGFEAYGCFIGEGECRTLDLAFPRGVVQCDFNSLADTLLGQLEMFLGKAVTIAAA